MDSVLSYRIVYVEWRQLCYSLSIEGIISPKVSRLTSRHHVKFVAMLRNISKPRESRPMRNVPGGKDVLCRRSY